MSDLDYVILTGSIESYLDSYGSKFKEQSFFEDEDFETAKTIVIETLNNTLYPQREGVVDLVTPPELEDLVEMLLKSTRPLFAFSRAMIEMKSHIYSVLGNGRLSRVLSDFSEFLNFAKVQKGSVESLKDKISPEVADIFIRTVFWDNDNDDEFKRKIGVCLEKLDPSEIVIPYLNLQDCSSVVAEFLVWITNMTSENEIAPIVVQAFMFFNNKLTEWTSCLSSADFAKKWIDIHLRMYFRIVVVQHRLQNAIKKVPEFSEIDSFDSSTTEDRFVILARLASVFGMQMTVEIKEYISELSAADYFIADHFGAFEIVFEKSSVDEYMWPFAILGVNEKSDITENQKILQEIIDNVTSESLKTRLQSLVSESLVSKHEIELGFKTTPVNFTPTQEVVTEQKLPDERTSEVELTKEETIGFDISLSEGGWDLDELNLEP